MKALNVAMCCNTAFGMSNFRAGVIKSLLKQGHRVSIIAPSQEPYTSALKELGAEFISWRLSGRSTHPWNEVQAVRQLTAIYHDLRPDIAFHYTIKAVIYGALAAKKQGIPCISVITGLGYVFLNASFISRIARILYAHTLKQSKEIWFLNAEDQDTFRKLQLLQDAPTFHLPGEGIDMNYFSPAPPTQHTLEKHSAKVFLLVARMLRDKGILEFVEAARQLRRKLPQARFQLLGAAGDDNPTAISRQEIDCWTSEGVVEYLGVTRDVRPAIAAADCVVLPSYREGAPRTLLEAAAMEKVLVATDVPGCRDVVVPGQTGLLCAPRDANDLAMKMEQIALMEEESIAAMGRKGRLHVKKHFDERIVINHYLNAIDRFRHNNR